VLFDMSQQTALAIASGMNGEELYTFDEFAKATITELSNMIAAQAVTKLHELGFEFEISLPALFYWQHFGGEYDGIRSADRADRHVSWQNRD